jgi:hypothetical protein
VGKLNLCAIAAASLLAGLFSLRADAGALSAEGQFEGVEETDNGWIIYMIVEERLSSAPLSPSCRYFVADSEVNISNSDAGLLNVYLHKPITVDIDQIAGQVLQCRFLE